MGGLAVKLIRHILVALVIATMPACATTDQLRPTEPGYRCNIKADTDRGMLSGQIEVSASGSTTGMVEGNFNRFGLNLGGYWHPQPDGQIDLNSGTLFFSPNFWQIHPRQKVRRQKLKLELSTTINPSYGVRRISSEFQRSDSPMYLEAAWGDVAAMARGSDHLYLLVRDKHSKVVDQLELDREMFVDVEPKIAETLDAAEKMIADPKKNCIWYADLHGDSIIVT